MATLEIGDENTPLHVGDLVPVTITSFTEGGDHQSFRTARVVRKWKRDGEIFHMFEVLPETTDAQKGPK